MRANSVSRPTGSGAVWMMPTSGWASISRARVTSALPGHHAVRVEHDHVRVRRAPVAHEVGDVAGLAAGVLRAAPIEDPPLAAVLGDQAAPGGLLGHRDVALAGVGQDEQIERRALALRRSELQMASRPAVVRRGSSLYTGMTSAMRLWMASPSASCACITCGIAAAAGG